MDATLVTAHSEKEGAAPTFRRGVGHHPLWTVVDHGPGGSGEPLSVLLRPGNAGSTTAADHLTVLREALRSCPGTGRPAPGRIRLAHGRRTSARQETEPAGSGAAQPSRRRYSPPCPATS
ncbi:hypothetical protein HF519_27525 [Pseudonocardia bannensis]|uniref:Transposase DDE domain-containing protein n=1 Tax=Pseudonocardia bannensis TaxID=630973 RepID=A0A848DR05_9PSEU|nr:hypothetical protein [Pseudonocardia bannensis]